MDSTSTARPRKPPLTPEVREQVNRDLRDSAWEQSDDESPPRLPRLKRPPEGRPLLDPEPKRTRAPYYPAGSIESFALAREDGE